MRKLEMIPGCPPSQKNLPFRESSSPFLRGRKNKGLWVSKTFLSTTNQNQEEKFGIVSTPKRLFCLFVGHKLFCNKINMLEMDSVFYGDSHLDVPFYPKMVVISLSDLKTCRKRLYQKCHPQNSSPPF